jgi:hypothetical protein
VIRYTDAFLTDPASIGADLREAMRREFARRRSSSSPPGSRSSWAFEDRRRARDGSRVDAGDDPADACVARPPFRRARNARRQGVDDVSPLAQPRRAMGMP